MLFCCSGINIYCYKKVIYHVSELLIIMKKHFRNLAELELPAEQQFRDIAEARHRGTKHGMEIVRSVYNVNPKKIKL